MHMWPSCTPTAHQPPIQQQTHELTDCEHHRRPCICISMHQHERQTNQGASATATSQPHGDANHTHTTHTQTSNEIRTCHHISATQCTSHQPKSHMYDTDIHEPTLPMSTWTYVTHAHAHIMHMWPSCTPTAHQPPIQPQTHELTSCEHHRRPCICISMHQRASHAHVTYVDGRTRAHHAHVAIM